MRNILIILFVIVSAYKSFSQKPYFFPEKKYKVKYSGAIERLMDNESKITKFNFITQYIPIYLSKNLKVIKCINLPLLIDFDVKKMLSGKFDTSYLVIVLDSTFYGSEYNDKDVRNSLKNLLRRKDSESETDFIKLFNFPFLNLKDSNKIFYNHNDDNTIDSNYQATEKITNTLYKISTKTHNDFAEYFLDRDNGLVKINYHWERINDYKIIIIKEKDLF